MKKIAILIVLAFLFSGNVFAGNNASKHRKKSATSLFVLAEVCYMIHLDADVYTRPNVGKGARSVTIDTGVVERHGTLYANWYLVKYRGPNTEQNPFVKLLLRNKLGFACSTVGAGTVIIANTILKRKVSPFVADAFLATMVAAEIWTIHSWAREGCGPKECRWIFYFKSF